MEVFDRNAVMSVGDLYREVGENEVRLKRLPDGMIKIFLKKKVD